VDLRVLLVSWAVFALRTRHPAQGDDDIGISVGNVVGGIVVDGGFRI